MIQDGLYKDDTGNKFWYKNNLYHREDGPAVESIGYSGWYLNGKCHREDGPARVWASGIVEYWFNDELYSKEEWEEVVKLKFFMRKVFDNRVEYYNDLWQLHRVDGPAVKYNKNYNQGYQAWYINGLLHRSDGHAQEDQYGNKAWWISGKLHREDGPAIERSNGNNEYWFDGKRYSKEEWEQVIKLKVFI